MLQVLRIRNLILVDNASAEFRPGLNIISGETGSGKTALLEGLRLVLGGRSDRQLIREGTHKAVVEAQFEVTSDSSLQKLLNDSGIDHYDHDQLVIRREVAATTSSRSFVNNQLVHTATLQRIGTLLVEQVNQHASNRLCSLDFHRHCVDLYGDCVPLLRAFQEALKQEREATKELEDLRSSEGQRLRDIETLRSQLEELDEANVEAGEEEAVFQEYTRTVHIEELQSGLRQATGYLNGDEGGIVPHFTAVAQLLQKLQSLDESLQEYTSTSSTLLTELQELDYSLRQLLSALQHHPARQQQLSDRLNVIQRLKTKYGPSEEELLAYRHDARARLERLESGEIELEEVETRLQDAHRQTDAHATALSRARRSSAEAFSTKLEELLKRLNMPAARFEVRMTNISRSGQGDDQLQFFLAPNLGEPLVPVRECASGGELARLLLATKALLAGKDGTPTMVFDEIDANIGGRTATVVGRYLRDLASTQQVICITHFPQVAELADHQLVVSKSEQEGRTITQIRAISPEARANELARMRGD